MSTFAPRDAIAITLPSNGFAVGVIGRLTAERMLVTTFGPALAALPEDALADGWEPTGWSTWIADTLGLRDGSWLAIPFLAGLSLATDIDFSRLPRFKGIDKNGKRKLAVYDPETLLASTVKNAEDAMPFTYRLLKRLRRLN